MKGLPNGVDISPQLFWGATNPGNVTVARFFPAGGLRTTIATTEGTVQIPMLRAGVFRRLYAKYNTAGSQAAVITVRIGGSDTALTVTITAGSTAVFTDLTHEVPYAFGDLVSVSSLTSVADNSTTNTVVSLQY